MSLAAVTAAMAASGCTGEQIAAAVAAHEAEEQRKRDITLAAEEAKREMRRAAAADRQARKRDRDALAREERSISNGSSRVTTRDNALHAVSHGDKAPVSASAPERVFVFSSEELPPSPPKGGSAPRKSGGSARGFRLPDDFEPDETTIATGERLGHTRRHVLGEGLDEFRDYWRGTPGAKGLRSDWQGTYRNRLRATAPRGIGQPRAGPPPQRGRTVAEMAAMNLDEPDIFDDPRSDPRHGAPESSRSADEARSGFAGRLSEPAARAGRRGALIDH